MSKSLHWKQNKQKIILLFWNYINGTFLIATSSFSSFQLFSGFWYLWFPPIKDYWLIYVLFLIPIYPIFKHCSLHLWRDRGNLYQYHYCTFLSHFLKSSFIASFYLMPCCSADRQQYKAKHISHWKYLPRPSPESVLFLLQLYLTQRHIHEITHNFAYFEDMEKISNRRKASKKYRSRNILFNFFHNEIKSYSSRKCSGYLNQIVVNWYEM